MNKKMTLNRDLSKILKGYENKWVALTPDFHHVSASGDSLQEVKSKLSDKEKTDLYFKRVIPQKAAYEPFYL